MIPGLRALALNHPPAPTDVKTVGSNPVTITHGP